MAFYEFSQNNSGGRFVVDSKLCHKVVIEAATKSQAVDIAESLGCYWDGCSIGRDCNCCGDRWHVPSSEFVLNNDYKYKGTIYSTEKHRTKTSNKVLKKRLRDWLGIENATITVNTSDIKIECNPQTLLEYYRFFVLCYAWTVPDVRVFYLDGKVDEIFFPIWVRERHAEQ